MALLNETDEYAARSSLGGLSKVVPSFYDLRYVTAPNLAGTLLVMYGLTFQDQLGGMFIWNPSDTSADNASTIIRPYSVPLASPGRWNLQLAQGQLPSTQVAGLGQGVRAVGAGGGSVTSADRGYLIASQGNMTLPAIATLGDGFVVAIVNTASIGTITVSSASGVYTPSGLAVTSITLDGFESGIFMAQVSGSNPGWRMVGGTGKAASAYVQPLVQALRATGVGGSVGATDAGYLIANSGGGTVTLGSVATLTGGTGKVFDVVILNSDAATNMTVATTGGQIIYGPFDGAGGLAGVTSLTLRPLESLVLVGSGTSWRVIGGSGRAIQATAYVPNVVALADGATVATNAALGNKFKLTTTQNFTLSAPTNPSDGQTIEYIITQGAGGSKVITFDAIFHPGTTLAALPVLSTAAGARDRVTFEYNSGSTQWDLLAYALGF